MCIYNFINWWLIYRVYQKLYKYVTTLECCHKMTKEISLKYGNLSFGKVDKTPLGLESKVSEGVVEIENLRLNYSPIIHEFDTFRLLKGTYWPNVDGQSGEELNERKLYRDQIDLDPIFIDNIEKGVVPVKASDGTKLFDIKRHVYNQYIAPSGETDMVLLVKDIEARYESCFKFGFLNKMFGPKLTLENVAINYSLKDGNLVKAGGNEFKLKYEDIENVDIENARKQGYKDLVAFAEKGQGKHKTPEKVKSTTEEKQVPKIKVSSNKSRRSGFTWALGGLILAAGLGYLWLNKNEMWKNSANEEVTERNNISGVETPQPIGETNKKSEGQRYREGQRMEFNNDFALNAYHLNAFDEDFIKKYEERGITGSVQVSYIVTLLGKTEVEKVYDKDLKCRDKNNCPKDELKKELEETLERVRTTDAGGARYWLKINFLNNNIYK